MSKPGVTRTFFEPSKKKTTMVGIKENIKLGSIDYTSKSPIVIGNVLKDMFLSDSLLAIAYRKHRADNKNGRKEEIA